MKKKTVVISSILVFVLMVVMSFGTFTKASDKDAVLKQADKVCKPYMEYIEASADEFGIAPEFIEAVIFYESAGQPKAVSHCNALGLMQIVEKWTPEQRKELGITDMFDPEQNIRLGSYLLLELFEEYEDPYTVLMCYNEGAYGGAVERAENCEWSDYAKKIVELSDNLQKYHGK